MSGGRLALARALWLLLGVLWLTMAPGIWSSGMIWSAAPSLIASFGMPKTTQLASS